MISQCREKESRGVDTSFSSGLDRPHWRRGAEHHRIHCRDCARFKKTWVLSKILHCRIFRPKILHCQFHLISTVLVIKAQKMSENGEIYTAWTNLTSGFKLQEVDLMSSFKCCLTIFLLFLQRWRKIWARAYWRRCLRNSRRGHNSHDRWLA